METKRRTDGILQRISRLGLGSYNTLIGLLIIIVILSFLSPVFLTVDNINNVMLQMSINGILAIGLTMVIITGGIDLSVGSVVAISGVFCGLAFNASGGSTLAAIAAAIASGTCFGILNGLMVSKGHLPAFIATLGMMTVARGGALYLCDGRPISGYSDTIKFLGAGRFLGIFVPILIMLFIYAVAYVVLKFTKTGRNIYAVGGNSEASRLSGIHVPRIHLTVFVISGFLAGVAAVLLTGRLNSAQPTAGYEYEMNAIASAVIGGTSLAGGEGRVMGTLIGAMIIQVMYNGLNLLNVSSYLKKIVIGLVIIGAVFLDVFRTKRKG